MCADSAPPEDLDSTPVSRVMARDLVVLPPGATIAAAAALMRERHVGSAVVLDDGGGLAGIVTERDVLMRVAALGKDPAVVLVSEAMTPSPLTLERDVAVSHAFDLVNAHGFRHVPVTDGGRAVGMVSMRDLLRTRLRHLEALLDQEVRALRELRDLLDQDEQTRMTTLLAVNERLHELALTDELTGLYNHRYLVRRVEEETARSRRTLAPMALLIVDVDHFKRVNDTWGHPTGDAVLRHLARVLQTEVSGATVLSRLRKSDAVARYGGEEFAVLLLDARLEGALAAGERIRRAVEAAVAPLPSGETVAITVSVGAASFPDEVDDPAGMLAAADAALYAAKAQGRNRVVGATGRR